MRKNKRSLHDLYLQAFQNTAERFKEGHDPAPIVKQLIVYGVKAINTKPEPRTAEEAIAAFQFASVIKDLIGTLTPAEFMNLFPIEKDFKGHKWGMKDYFYTRDYINGLNPDEPIGDALEFMWEYTNREITDFNVAVMGYLSDLRRLEGKPSLAAEWAAMNGIKTYTMHTDDKGKQYLLDPETGKTTKISKPKPKHLRVIK